MDNLLTELQEKHSDKISNASREWNGSKDLMNYSFSAMGFNVSGNVVLGEDGLVLNGKLPLAARMFKGKIKSTVESALDDLF